MSNKPAGIGSPADTAEPELDVTEEVLSELDRLLVREIEDMESLHSTLVAVLCARGELSWPTPDDLVIATPVIWLGKAYIDALGKRAADGSFDLVGRIRFRRKRGTREIHLGIDGGGAASLVFPGDLPDEARLALLDLDVTAEELRGKELRWDAAAGAWRP